MNKKKLIFAIIGVVLIILLLIGLIFMKGSNKGGAIHKKSSSGVFEIWTVGDSPIKFKEIITHFKEKNKNFSSVEYNVINFPNYAEYQEALTSAFIKGEAPDLFVLNNNEKSIFEEKTLKIPNNIIDITQFQKDYEGVFIDDLVIKETNEKDSEIYDYYLKGMPVGYETLGIFYNKGLGFISSDFKSLNSLFDGVKRIRKNKQDSSFVPIAIGSGKNVSNTADIISHLYLTKNITSLNSAKQTKDEEVLYTYTKFGLTSGINGYNSLSLDGKSDIKLFVDEKVGAIVGYPRLALKLQSKGLSKTLISAQAFPHKYKNDELTFINYNYFVINSNTPNKETAFAFLQYLNSTEGQKLYLKKYKYYLPSKLILLNEIGNNKISEFFYRITISNFYSSGYELSSFNKGNKVLFDKGINEVLDDTSGFYKKYENFKNRISCKTDKILNLKNLSKSCE